MSRTHAITQALSPEYVLLGLLNLRPYHGYELHQRLESELGHVWRISLSQVYNILNRLHEQGYIQSERKPPERRSDRESYRLTEAGVQRLETWMRSPLGPSVRAVRMAFITKLYLAHARGEPALDDLVAVQQTAVVEALQRLRERFESIPQAQIFNRLSLRLRINQLESLLTWLEGCLNLIDA